MATVYKAYDANMDRYVALKVLPRQYAEDENFVARFHQEARAVARLEHIHILPIFTYGEDNGITYMVMRLMEHGTLSDRLQDKTASFAEAARITTQLAAALDYAHAHGVIHRDLKPSNVLVDETGNVFLTDFGIAKIMEATAHLTGTGAVLGTPIYMSPEQCLAQPLTPASDQYTLAVVTYKMLTATTPHYAETPLAVIRMHMLGEPLALPRSLRPDLPERAEAVLLKALSREADQRYPTCHDFAVAFEHAIRGVADTTNAYPLPPQDAIPTATAPGDTLSTVVDMPSTTQQTALKTSDATHPPGTAAIGGSHTSKLTPDGHLPRRRRRWLWSVGISVVIILSMGLWATQNRERNPFVAFLPSTATLTPTVTTSPTTTQTPTVTAKPTEAITRTPASTPRVVVGLPEDVDSNSQTISNILQTGLLLEDCGENLRLCAFEAPHFDRAIPVYPDGDLDSRIYGGAALHPDGTQFVFSALGSIYDPDTMSASVLRNSLYFANLDGTITNEMVVPGNRNPVTPAWSPDGQWIVFHASCELAIIRPNGENFRILRDTPIKNECYLSPEWSPDGQYITVLHTDASIDELGTTLEYMVIPLESPDTPTIIYSYQRTEADPCRDGRSAFSPDGTQIMIIDSAACQPAIIAADGSQETPTLIYLSGVKTDFAFWWTSAFWPRWGEQS